MDIQLQKRILTTLCFYNVLDYPLTAFEIYKYLNNLPKDTLGEEDKNSLSQIIGELESDNLKKFVIEKNGFYFLRGADGTHDFFSKRIERSKLAFRKLKKARLAAKILRFIPFVKMVGVTGKLAMKNSGSSGDLDFLVVLERGKIWTGRAMVSAVTHVLGLRRHGNKIADRVCLNFYLTTESLEVGFKDLFFAHEYSFIIPLFGWRIFKKFQMENSWIKDYKINFSPDEIENLYIVYDNWPAKFIRQAGEKLLSAKTVEKFFKSFQEKRIENKERLILGNISREESEKFDHLVEASDQRLVFWPRQPKTLEAFSKKLESLRNL